MISACMTKLIQDCFGFTELCIAASVENLRHPLNQSNAKLKPITRRQLAFSRALVT